MTPVPLPRATRPVTAAGAVAEIAIGIEIGHARDVVGLQGPVRRDAAAERDRKHHGAGAEHAAPAFGSNLGLSQRGMPESDEVSDLVGRDRLQIEARRPPRPAPWTTSKTELKKTSDSTISPVASSTTNEVAPSTRSMLGLGLESKHRETVVFERHRAT